MIIRSNLLEKIANARPVRRNNRRPWLKLLYNFFRGVQRARKLGLQTLAFPYIGSQPVTVSTRIADDNNSLCLCLSRRIRCNRLNTWYAFDWSACR